MMRNTNELKKTKNDENYVGVHDCAQKGITLIALIITIIVMLILVSVTISMAVNGGLFEYAGKSVSDTENAINAEQTLANGEIKIGDTWYNSMDDYLAGVESVKSLQEKHEFTYYSSLVKAVTDVNNNTRENADANKENAVAGIYTEDGKHTVVLLKDTTEETRVEPKVDMTINLGGYTLDFNCPVGIDCYSGNINIDGRLSNSSIKISQNGDNNAVAIQLRADGELLINGGLYIGISEEAKKASNAVFNFAGDATIKNATVYAASAKGRCRALSIFEGASISAYNCDFKAYANYENLDDVISYGIFNVGTLNLNNCYSMGVASGVHNAGVLYVNGGTYEGYGYGGIKFHYENVISYVKNATIRECAMPEGYTATIDSEHTGFYIGNESTDKNLEVYVDNCDIYGSKNPININYGTNNELYISNSRINTDKQINIGTGHKLYLGKGNNFTAENTNNPTAVVKTEEVYVQEN